MALLVSLDGFIEGPNGETDWIETWENPFDLRPQIDTCILGGAMYPDYEHYRGAILANPAGVLPFTGKVASKGEIDYVQFAEKSRISSCPKPWTRPPRRTRESFGTSKKSAS